MSSPSNPFIHTSTFYVTDALWLMDKSNSATRSIRVDGDP